MLSATVTDLDLTSLDGLASALTLGALQKSATSVGAFNGTYCPNCGDLRRMHLRVLKWRSQFHGVHPGATADFTDSDTTGLFRATCLQCHAGITLLVYPSPQGPDLIALPSSYGGLSTPNTPEAVAYYLDQAQRSQAVSARSAAVSMYRSALEQLLFHEGYTSGMLKAKIDALLGDSSPPAWKEGLEPEYLEVIKDLGNAAIHPNDGDVEKQSALEAKVLQEVGALFAELLDRIYEQPAKKAARLAGLRQVADSFKKPSGGASA